MSDPWASELFRPDTRLATPKMVRVEWTHPHTGRVIEIVCRRHVVVVLDALRTQRIGSTQCAASVNMPCARCATDGIDDE